MLHTESVKEVRTRERPSGLSERFDSPEQRRHIRYERAGSLRLDCQGHCYTGAVVNVGNGGILFRPDAPTPRGARGTVVLQIKGFPTTMAGEIRVLRRNRWGVAAAFISSPTELRQCIPWLPNRTEETCQ